MSLDKIIFDSDVSSQNIQSKISLIAIDKEFSFDNSFGVLIYKAERADETYQISFSFDADNNKMDLGIDFAPALKASCLFLSGIALAGPILDCKPV